MSGQEKNDGTTIRIERKGEPGETADAILTLEEGQKAMDEICALVDEWRLKYPCAVFLSVAMHTEGEYLKCGVIDAANGPQFLNIHAKKNALNSIFGGGGEASGS